MKQEKKCKKSKKRHHKSLKNMQSDYEKSNLRVL